MVKIKNTKTNLAKCICGTCPSYNECMKKNKELLFCSTGKSKCEFVKKGCVCGGCPIHIENQLDKWYYCDIGASK